MAQCIKLMLTIEASCDIDEDMLENFVKQLRDDLLQLDIDSVDHIPADIIPEGAKGDAEILGTLIVLLAASKGVLTTVINAVQSWMSAREQRCVIMEIDGDKLTLTGIPSKDQQRIINAWLKRRALK